MTVLHKTLTFQDATRAASASRMRWLPATCLEGTPVPAVDRMALAAHLHLHMRRHLGRVTDVEWLAVNRDYALEMVRIALQTPHAELHDWARKLEASFPAPRATGPIDSGMGDLDSTPRRMVPNAVVAASAPSNRYVGRLR